jgi:hypothetical protein
MQKGDSYVKCGLPPHSTFAARSARRGGGGVRPLEANQSINMSVEFSYPNF